MIYTVNILCEREDLLKPALIRDFCLFRCPGPQVFEHGDHIDQSLRRPRCCHFGFVQWLPMLGIQRIKLMQLSVAWRAFHS